MEMKQGTIHDVLKSEKSYTKAIELMPTDPKIIKDWMKILQM